MAQRYAALRSVAMTWVIRGNKVLGVRETPDSFYSSFSKGIPPLNELRVLNEALVDLNEMGFGAKSRPMIKMYNVQWAYWP